ncbi:hypothetical protein ABZ946_01795 [Streptomyces sp. NPDC046324]|uniref:hypothetical protein n=1 Tax=Streptomyces sp. NPDC046324 TaxID=3154915 RepID=UPI0033FD1121
MFQESGHIAQQKGDKRLELSTRTTGLSGMNRPPPTAPHIVTTTSQPWLPDQR